MDNTTLKRIFDFLEEKENINKPFKWKLLNNEPFAEEDLNVKGDLDLEKANITSLPRGLKVTRSLDLAFSKITSLPEGLEVSGNLYIRKTELEKYSDFQLRDMIRPGFIKGKIIRRWKKNN